MNDVMFDVEMEHTKTGYIAHVYVFARDAREAEALASDRMPGLETTGYTVIDSAASLSQLNCNTHVAV